MKTFYVVVEGFCEDHAKQFHAHDYGVTPCEFGYGPDALMLGNRFFWDIYSDIEMRIGIAGVPEVFPPPNLQSGFYHAGYPYFYEIPSTWPTWDTNIVRDPAMWARVNNRDCRLHDWSEEVVRHCPPDQMLDAAYKDQFAYLGNFIQRAHQYKIRVGLIWLAWPYRLRQITNKYRPSALEECARVWSHFSQEFAENTVIVGLSKNGFIASQNKTLVSNVDLSVLLENGIEHKSSDKIVLSTMVDKLRADLNGNRSSRKS